MIHFKRIFSRRFTLNAKIGLLIPLFLFNFSFVFGQKKLNPKKKSDAFGTTDYRDLRNYGPQISFGPTYLLTSKRNETIAFGEPTRPSEYTIDPKGSLGGYFDFGMAHFPTKTPRILLFGKRIISYYDYGIGLKIFRGQEMTNIKNYDGSGNLLSETDGKGKFTNGYVSARFSFHKNFHIGSKYFIDNGLGMNMDYRIINGDQEYQKYQNFQGPTVKTNQQFHSNFVAQLHYSLGLGIRLKRGSYLIPGLQIPILGIYDFNKGNPGLRWYSSNYVPLLFTVKFIKILEKKKGNGCSNVGSEEDKKRNKEYMQGQ